MPVKVKRKGKGWVAADDKGKAYSNRVMTKAQATRQARAINANMHKSGKRR